MHFTILCLGTHGDIRPFVALGAELKRRGHSVRIGADPHDRQFCLEWGLDFFPLVGDLAKMIASKDLSRMSKFEVMHAIVRFFDEVLEEQFETLLKELQGTNAIIYHTTVTAAYHLAERFKLPAFRVRMQPDERTRYYPSCVFPPNLPFGKFGNLVTHLLTEQIFWQPLRKKINRVRRSLNMPKMNFWGPGFDRYFLETPSLIAVSSHLVPRPPDWRPNIHMTGFFHLNLKEQWHPPQALTQFLEEGKPPLYVGFGSLSPKCPKDVLDQIIKTVQEQHLRVIFSGDFSDRLKLPASENLFYLPSVPHDWLFPRVQAVVHHGGSGTLGASLRAGKPTFILPFIVDQFHWGKRVHELSLGPKPIPAEKFNFAHFSTRLKELTVNPFYQQNAQAMALKMSQENGVEEAARLILHYLQKKS